MTRSQTPGGLELNIFGLILAGYLQDLRVFDRTSLLWSILSAPSPPSPRTRHGLVASNGALYLFGGIGAAGPVHSGSPEEHSHQSLTVATLLMPPKCMRFEFSICVPPFRRDQRFDVNLGRHLKQM